jgi:nucleoside diphosphate kinase
VLIAFDCWVCSLRAKFGVDGLQNAVHASESVAVANEELAVLFSEYKID